MPSRVTLIHLSSSLALCSVFLFGATPTYSQICANPQQLLNTVVRDDDGLKALRASLDVQGGADAWNKIRTIDVVGDIQGQKNKENLHFTSKHDLSVAEHPRFVRTFGVNGTGHTVAANDDQKAVTVQEHDKTRSIPPVSALELIGAEIPAVVVEFPLRNKAISVCLLKASPELEQMKEDLLWVRTWDRTNAGVLSVVDLAIATNTGLPIRMRTLAPQLQRFSPPTWRTIEFGNYGNFGGLLIPTNSLSIEPGNIYTKTQITTVALNGVVQTPEGAIK